LPFLNFFLKNILFIFLSWRSVISSLPAFSFFSFQFGTARNSVTRYALITGASAILPNREMYTRHFLAGTSTDRLPHLHCLNNEPFAPFVRSKYAASIQALRLHYGAGTAQVVMTLRTGRPKNHGSISGRSNGGFSSPKRTDRLGVQPSLLSSRCRGYYPRG
jgi:hypothetical protein